VQDKKMKKFKKGKHTYTDWGKGVKEVKKLSEEKKVQKQVPIKLDEDIAMGKYANLGFIGHTQEEFTLDFIYAPPGPSGNIQPKVVSRIITSPGHAKRLLIALRENIEKYESKFGQISPAKALDKKIGFN
jgi:hypothetical protein